jgi:hypothetical protein
MKTTPIPTFPLRGKEVEGKSASEVKSSLPIRGRARVGVVRKTPVNSVPGVWVEFDLFCAFEKFVLVRVFPCVSVAALDL